ncbi:predicted protein [Chaetoceros tenuissimus]|uniref:ShKT domain-containing protein n=1 Tax=Chaetoceros tenuissimus TaxID=426638 RepID=A0AAD3CSR2_9STRA|nr:predicted protein [Chaetoceros tenuissimus]
MGFSMSVDAPLHTECKDDEQFFFLDNTKYNCDWLRRNLEYRDIFCDRDSFIRQHCKQTCIQCTTSTSSPHQDRVNDETGIIMTIEEDASWWATLHPTQAPTVKREAGEVTLSPTSRTLLPTDCYDDRSYRYPLDQSKDCSAFVDDDCILEHERELSRDQLQDLLKKCPRACNVPCNYTLENTSRPTIAPRISRLTRSTTNRPTREPTLEITSRPTIAPRTSLPTRSRTDRPTIPPTTDRPTSCFDDRSYQYPLNPSLGCAYFQGEDCFAYDDRLSKEEIVHLLYSCPNACNVDCNEYTPSPTYTISIETRADNEPSSTPSLLIQDTNTPAPTISTQPTDCYDDRSYTSPLDPTKRCEDFEDCFSYRDQMTLDQFQELLLRCPMTCKVGCNYQVLTDSPTISSSPSSVRSERPSFGELSDPNTMDPTPSTPSPTINREPTIPNDSSCQDDPDYRTPVGGYTCQIFQIFTSCENANLSTEYKQEAIRRCPISCNASCQELSSSPSISPSQASCEDDPSYAFPIPMLKAKRCNVFLGHDCYYYSKIFKEEIFLDIINRCPLSCGLCVIYD